MTEQFPVQRAIFERRTIKKFKPDAIPLETLEQLLDVAVWAPNHKMREPWRFIIITGNARASFVRILEEESLKGKDAVPMKEAKIAHWLSIPAYVVVVQQEDPRPQIREEDFAAVSALIQNFQLAAWEQGIGTLWNTNKHIYNPVLREAIGVTLGEKIVGVIQAGYPAHVPAAMERTPAKEKLTILTNAF